MRRTPSCAMLVASVNMHGLISCSMQSPAVLWIPLKMRKTGKRQPAVFGQIFYFLDFKMKQDYNNCGALFCTLQAVTNINTLLDKADRVYHQLMGHRPQLESLLSKVNEAAPEKPQVSQHVQRTQSKELSVNCEFLSQIVCCLCDVLCYCWSTSQVRIVLML